MVNAVILHCPGDEDRARFIGQAWREGRATLAMMGPHRRRIALGARSVLIGLWSDRATTEDGGRQLASVLERSAPRSLLVVWDGRPPLDAVTDAGVPVVIAPADPMALVERLQKSGSELIEGQALATDFGRKPRKKVAAPSSGRAQMWGIIAGLALAALLALGGLAPFLTRAEPAPAASAAP